MTRSIPPSSALDLHNPPKNTDSRTTLAQVRGASSEPMTIDQFKINNAKLAAQIMMQMDDSTPQFNYPPQNKPNSNQQLKHSSHGRLEAVDETLQEVSQFRYTPDDTSPHLESQDHFHGPDISTIQNSAKMELL